MHVVRLLALQLDMESHTKDIDFSLSGIMKRWTPEYAHTKTVLDRFSLDRLSSILSRRLFFTSRWNCRLQRSQRRAIFT